MCITKSDKHLSEIDNSDLFKQEVSQLLKWLEQTNERTCAHWRQNIHSGLIENFKNTANKYVCLACEIIPHATKDEQAYYYGEALRKITGHASLLAYLVGQIGDGPTKEGQLSKLDAMQALIWHISKGLPSKPPILIPVLASQFMFAHLNYVNEVGIIGVPIYALTSPYPDLPILWHEVGAYQVARDRTTVPSLKERAAHLKKRLNDEKAGIGSVWDLYENSYKQIVENSCKQIVKPEGMSYAIADEFIKTYINTDSEWQLTWLGQILSDLFGLQALGGTMLKSLSIALARAYKRQDYTDLDHPQPKLRLQIACEYLKANKTYLPEDEEPENNETVKLAEAIIEYLHTEYPERWTPMPSDDPITQLIIQLVDKAFASPEGDLALLDELSTNSAILAAFQECREHLQTHVVEESELIWKLVGSTSPPPTPIKGFETNLAVEENLNRFRKINFMETDEVAPPKGQLVPPFGLIVY